MDPDRKRRRTASDLDESNASNTVNGDSPSSFKYEQSHSSEGTPNNSSNLLLRPAERASEDTGDPHASPSEAEEEAENHTMTRMLVDPTGRLCEFPSTCCFAQFMSGWRLKAHSGVQWSHEELIPASRHKYRYRTQYKDSRVLSGSVKIPVRKIVVRSRGRAYTSRLCVDLDLFGNWSGISCGNSEILRA